jgi:hypothetical protein
MEKKKYKINITLMLNVDLIATCVTENTGICFLNVPLLGGQSDFDVALENAHFVGTESAQIYHVVVSLQHDLQVDSCSQNFERKQMRF